jgi:hypothetical protein
LVVGVEVDLMVEARALVVLVVVVLDTVLMEVIIQEQMEQDIPVVAVVVDHLEAATIQLQLVAMEL